MGDQGAVLTGGGVAGLIVAVAYGLRLVLDWRAKRGDEHRAHTAGAIADAATANATLVQTVETLQRENSRMARKIKHLEDEAAEKDRKIEDLTSRVNEIAAELAALKTH
jgi:chromosome segregation ATPase